MKKMKSGSISNVWNKLQLFCQQHDEPVQMELASNTADFKEPYFRCPCEGCVNHNYLQRITIHDFEVINENLEKGMLRMGIVFDMTNYRFQVPRKDPARDLDIKVIKCSGEHIKLGVK